MSIQSEPIPNGTRVQVGACELIFGQHIEPLRESSVARDDLPTLRRRLEEDGYLFLRKFHPREEVLAARAEILSLLDDAGCLEPGQPREMAVIGKDESRRGVSSELAGENPVFYDVQNKSKTVLFKLPLLAERVRAYTQLVGSERFVQFFGDLLGGEAEARLNNSIPRAVPTGEFTGAHYDVVYFGPHNDHIFTGWMPLGDVPLELGPLAVVLGSHRFERVRGTYGRMHTSRDRIEGWFSTDALEMVEKFGARWASANFQAGDVVLFSMYFMHGSLNNMTNCYRLSSDCRYQRVADRKPEPPAPPSAEGPLKSMDEARKAWDV